METYMDLSAITSSTPSRRHPFVCGLAVKAAAFTIGCSLFSGSAQAQPTLIFREGGTITLSNDKEVVIEEIAYHTAVGPYAWAARVKASGADLIAGNVTDSKTIDWLVDPHSWSEGAQLGLETSFGLMPTGELVYSALIADRPALLPETIHGVLDSVWMRSPAALTDDMVIARRGDNFNAILNGASITDTAWTATSMPRVAGSGEVLFVGASAEKLHYPSSRRGLWMWKGGGAAVELLCAGYGQAGPGKFDYYPIAEFSTTPLGSTVWTIGNTDNAGVKGQAVFSLDLRNTPPVPVIRMARGETITRPGQQPEAITAMRSVVGAEASPCGSAAKWAMIAQTGTYQKRNFVLVNGQPALWEGVNIGGTTTLTGEPSSVAMNETGDWAVGWTGKTLPVPGPGPAVEAPVLLLNGAPVDISGLIDGQWAIESFVRGGSSGGAGSLAISSRNSELGVRIFATALLRDTLSSATPQPRVRALISLWAPSLSSCCPVDLTGDYQGTVHVPDGKVDDQDAQLFGLWSVAKDIRGDLDDGSGTGTPDGVFDQDDIDFFFNHYFMGCS